MAQQTLDNGVTHGVNRGRINANFDELYSREIVPVSPYTVATVQAAFDTAVANCLAGTGPRRVAFYENFTGADGIFIGNASINAPANMRIVGLEVYFAPNVQTRKTAADFNSGHANCLFQFTYCKRVTIIGGTHYGRVNDTYYEDTILPFVVPGTVPNGASTGGTPLLGFLDGDDGFRLFSCDDIIMRDMEFRNYGDAAYRICPLTTDTDELAGNYGSKRVRVQNCRVINSRQTSTTNNSGNTAVNPYEFTMVDCYGERMNSHKWAHCSNGSRKSKGLRIINSTCDNSRTGYEIDGLSQVLVSGCSMRNMAFAGFSWISNDTVAVTSSPMDTIRIVDTFIEGNATMTSAVIIAPDTQGADHVCPAVVFDVTVEGMTNASSTAIYLAGKFTSVTGRVVINGFAGQTVIREILRDSKNVHIAVSGTYDRNDGNGHVFSIERYVGALSNVGLSESVTCEFDGVTTQNCLRYLIVDGVKNLTLTGEAGIRGAATALGYFDTLNGVQDLNINALNMRTTGAVGLLLNAVKRGVISGSILGAASSTPLVVNNTCAGVEVLESVKLMNGDAWAAGGDGRGYDNQQAFLMASATRSGVNVDVTITHGLGTDFTVPSNAQRSFELIRPDGSHVPISSVARQGATTLRAALAYDIGTAGTASGATTNAAGYAIGATSITLASAGTGTIVAGNYVKFGPDPNPYFVIAGDADVSNGGTLTLASPGLKVAIAASATAITFATNTFVHHERPIFNLENGGTFNAAGYRPVDNSTSLALLKRGSVSVS